LRRAQAGDGEAFEELVAPYRAELEAHCYRLLGSLTDAEDALQESLVAAWKGMRSFRGDASVRTWLYRVTTRRCLNLLRAARRRIARNQAAAGPGPAPQPSRFGEISWLEPYPDTRLEEIADSAAGPEQRYERREAISLAFITALQMLPSQARAILILRDVLDFSARETAAILDTTVDSTNSALRRARAKLARQLPDDDQHVPRPDSPEERELLERLVLAWESCDIPGLVDLMTEDVWLRMPPSPLEYQGREEVARWLSTVVFRDGRRWRLAPTRANGQPAVGLYLCSSVAGVADATRLVVLTLARGRIGVLTLFTSELLERFGLPPVI
jgi:RNA polymerase sigma-70 factor (ECF subfamily)